MERRQRGAACAQRVHKNLGGQVADQRILREGAAAQAADGRVEAPATGLVRRAHALCRVLTARMQMHADLKAAMRRQSRTHRLGNLQT